MGKVRWIGDHEIELLAWRVLLQWRGDTGQPCDVETVGHHVGHCLGGGRGVDVQSGHPLGAGGEQGDAVDTGTRPEVQGVDTLQVRSVVTVEGADQAQPAVGREQDLGRVLHLESQTHVAELENPA